MDERHVSADPDIAPPLTAPATIRDVARAAGVSVATVSRVISVSGYPVRAETREKVLAAAERLQFYPNQLARGLFTERTNTIGVLVPDATNPYFPEVLRGVEDVAFENRIAVIFCNVDHLVERQRYYIDVLLQRRVDGLISAGGDYDWGQSAGALARMQTTLVLIGRREGVEFPTVELPDEEGGGRAARHLVELGHRRIAFISGGATSQASADRLHGATTVISDAGLAPPLVRIGDFSEAGGHAVARDLLSSDDRPTAIIAANDRMAIGVAAAARDLGINVPRDLSVVGFDNLPVSRFVRPALTTVEASGVSAGREAMRVMLAAFAGDPPAGRIVMPCELIVRESTGPAR